MYFFGLILIIVVGYFLFVSIAMSRADDKKAFSKIALVMLMVYGCVVAMLAAIGQYLGEIGLLLYVVALLYSIFFLLWKIYGLSKVRPQIQMGVVVILISYMLAVLYVTTFMRESGANNQVQMEVMNWLREDSVESFDHMFLNMAMFVPIGIIYPFITKQNKGQLISSVSFGILLSTAIETGQLFLRSGTCDIDDILSNSLGTLIGAAVAAIGMKFKQKSIKKAR